MVILAVILIIIGISTAFFPYESWYLSIGWQFKNAEPSDLALTMQRLVGIIVSIIGLTLLISSCSYFIAQSAWPKDFKRQLRSEHISSIAIGYGANPLSKEVTEEIISLIYDADFSSVKDKNNFLSFDTVIEIGYKDGRRETIYKLGSRFEIFPPGGIKYIFSSEDLKRLIQEYK